MMQGGRHRIAGGPDVFFGASCERTTLRVMPQEMTIQMHMLGLMYAPTDRLTLMAMLPYVEKSMTSRAYTGPAKLGASTMRSEGLDDIRIGGTYGPKTKGPDKLLLNMTLSLPTGSITQSGTMLSSIGMQMTRRMACPMIVGPMQGTNPVFQGGDIGLAVYQDLNGPRLGTDWVMGVAWRKMF